MIFCGVQIQQETLRERIQFNILGETVGKNDLESHRVIISSSSSSLLFIEPLLHDKHFICIISFHPCNNTVRQLIFFYYGWMRKLKSGNLPMAIRWQILDLNADPTHALNHQGLTNQNLPEYTSAENMRAWGNPESSGLTNLTTLKLCFQKSQPERMVQAIFLQSCSSAYF